MERLRALTETLVDMKSLVVPVTSGMQEYKVEQGYAMAMTLKHNEDVAVAQSFLSAGTIFPYHCHELSEEILIIYKGEVTIVTENDRKELKAGDSIHICKGCGHLLHAKTDVKIIAITIPPDAIAMPKMNGDGE
jgi:quercetin dioxygenase-like cupin family protein